VEILSSFQTFIRTRNLFSGKERILLAVSGGLDSVVMAHLFKEAGYSFALAHCNFGLRGKESDGDEVFVRKLAEKLGVELYSTRFETQAYASRHKQSIQEAARELRYSWFEETRKREKFSFVATAHHQDDAIETFFINLLRQSGAKGLGGISVLRGTVIRPLLFASRPDLAAYAKKKKIKFREDSSNTKDDYLRNKIRHKLIPVLEQVQPSYRQSIGQTMHYLEETGQMLKTWMEKEEMRLWQEGEGFRFIRWSDLMELKPLGFYLHELLSKYGFKANVCQSLEKLALAKNRSGRMFSSPSYTLITERDILVLRLNKPDKKHKNKLLNALAARYKTPFPFSVELVNRDELDQIPVSANVACLDADKLKFPLLIRPWQEGDRFCPLGMKGSKLLSDYFTDQKIDALARARTMVLETEGQIAWLLGYRIDERYKISGQTCRVILIRLG
jgi:tRNA(Ile)-lysidine synthase